MTKRKKICLALGCLASVSIGVCGCHFQKPGDGGQKLPELIEPSSGESYTLQAEPPEGLPTEYNGLENISFMAYKLAHTDAFHTESESRVDTTIGFISYVQEIKTFKDYADGVMLVEDITKSSLVNAAQQTCFVGDRTLWRKPASSRPGDWKDKQTVWASGDPSNYSVGDYMKIYGLPSTEFCVYVLNEETLTEWSEVTDNGDGTYTQTVYPDVETAGAYYAIRMKTMGGLSTYPTFNSIAMTYTFTADWTVLSCEVSEDYAVDLGILHSDHSKAVTKQNYYYDREGVDISDYYDFFSRYVEQESEGDVTEETKKELTATDCLSAAFGEILVEEKELLVSVGLNGQMLDGRVYVDLEQEDFRIRLGGLDVWYAEENIYLALSDGLVKISTDDLGTLLSSLMQDGEGGSGSSVTDLLSGLDFDQLLQELGGGTFLLSDMGATLEANLTFGDTVLPLYFSFLTDGENVTLDYVELKEITLGEQSVSARLRFAQEETLPALGEEQKATAGDLMDVVNTAKETVDVIQSKEFAFTLAVETEAAEEKDYYFRLTLAENVLYLSVSYYADETDANYAPLLLKGEIGELASLLDTAERLIGYDIPFLEDLLSSLLPSAGEETETSLSLDDLLDVPSWLDSFSLADGRLTLSLNGKLTGLDGNLDLSVYKEEKTLGFGCSWSGWQVGGALTDRRGESVAPEGEYIDVSSVGGAVDSLIDSLFALEDNVLSPLEEYHFAGKIGCSIGGYTLDFDLGLNLSVAEKTLNVSLGAGSTFAVNSGRYLSYVTLDLESGMIYMQRYQYEYYSVLTFKEYAEPVVTYRAMTMQEFGDDYWNQITYLTNMGDVVAGLIKDQIDKPSDPSETPLYDVGSYVNGYSYNAETGEYSLSLNGKNFADFLGNMALVFKVNGENELTGIYGSVEIYVTLSLDIHFENVTNPGEYALTKTNLADEWLETGRKEHYEMTVTSGHTTSQKDLTGVAQYVSSVTLKNGDRESVLSVVYGQPLGLPVLENTETARFGGWFTEENGGTMIAADGTDDGLGGGVLYARWIGYVTLTLDAGEGKASVTEIKTVPDELWAALQAVSVERDGYDFVAWTAENGERVSEENILSFVNGKLIAEYREVLHMTFVSDVPCTAEGIAGELKEYRTEWKGVSALPAPTAEGYLFFGWALTEGDGYTLLPAGTELAIGEDKTAYALWVKNDLSVTVNTVSRKKVVFVYTWDIAGGYSGGAFAEGQSAALAEQLGVTSSASVLYRLSDDGSTVKDTLNSGDSFAVSGGSFSKSGMTSMKDGSYGGVSLTLTYTCGDVTLTLTADGWKAK